jgi:hypothetical protein
MGNPSFRRGGDNISMGAALSVPIQKPDGTTMVFSSSTMSAQYLKEVKEHLETKLELGEGMEEHPDDSSDEESDE